MKTPTPVARDASCSLQISGIPPAGASSYLIRIGDSTTKLASLEPAIAFAGDEATVNLIGPRYFASRIVGRDECRPGAKIPLEARRKEASLRFTQVPPNTTAECISGPPCRDDRPHLISDGGRFPSIPMSDDQVVIELRFKASGYEPKTIRHQVQPGPNELAVDLRAHGE